MNLLKSAISKPAHIAVPVNLPPLIRLTLFCRFVLPCQILLPPIKTVGSTIQQRKILPVKLFY